ncbi:hypothetical protein [Kitasatospora camelliae]|uniref:PH (Pleckstrin Homology) domain-containing protein n=1 Tax=Kitasatospora camelliae TaxID=3156397 RepID=A0AAU8K8B7_9ACTN
MTQHQSPSSSGQQVTRRQARWERYRVTHPFSATDQAGLWAAILGTVGLALLLGWALEIRGGTVIVLALPFIISWFENRRTAFQFDAAGVRVGEVRLRWNDVTQFVVATPPDGPYALIGVRLHPSVTLPPGATVPPQNPAMPAPIHVAVLRSKFDLAKMVAKARRYAAPHVQIVVADQSGERVAA